MSRPTLVLVAILLLAAGSPVMIGGAAAADVTVELKVVNQAGDPVGGAELTLISDGEEQTGTTTGDGRALFDLANGSEVEIQVDHGTYMRNHPFVIQSVSGGVVEIPVARSGILSVTVQGQTGPVEGADIALIRDGRYAATATTDSDGTVQTEPVEVGQYGFRVTKPGYYENYTEIQIDGPTEVIRQIRPGAVQLQFNVSDDHFSPPRGVENATVQITELGTTLRTLEDGGVSVSVPVNRRYHVAISKPGFGDAARTVDIREAGRVVEATIQRIPEVSVTVANQRVVVGESTQVTVRNAYDEPVAGARVTVAGTSVGQTSEQGVIDVPIESEGNLTIRASMDELSDTVTVEGVSGVQPTATVTATATATPTTTTGGGGPGFGLVAAAVALLAVVALRRGRNT